MPVVAVPGIEGLAGAGAAGLTKKDKKKKKKNKDPSGIPSGKMANIKLRRRMSEGCDPFSNAGAAQLTLKSHTEKAHGQEQKR